MEARGWGQRGTSAQAQSAVALASQGLRRRRRQRDRGADVSACARPPGVWGRRAAGRGSGRRGTAASRAKAVLECEPAGLRAVTWARGLDSPARSRWVPLRCRACAGRLREARSFSRGYTARVNPAGSAGPRAGSGCLSTRRGARPWPFARVGLGAPWYTSKCACSTVGNRKSFPTPPFL